MRIMQLLIMMGMAMVFVALPGTAGDTAKPITLDLRSFTFKAPKGKEDLVKYDEFESKLSFYINGTAEAKVEVPKDGDYQIAIKASCDKALKEGAKFKLAVDGKPCGKETETSEGQAKEYTFATPLKAGPHKLVIEFTNDVFKEGEYDRNLFVHAVSPKKLK